MLKKTEGRIQAKEGDSENFRRGIWNYCRILQEEVSKKTAGKD
jgi:hypothetical protein